MLLRRETLLAATGLAAFLTAGQVEGSKGTPTHGSLPSSGNAESAEATADAAFGFEIGNAKDRESSAGGVVDPVPWLIPHLRPA